MPQEYKARAGQSVFDVCLNTYGTLDLTYRLLQDSGVEDIETAPTTGQVFTFNPALTVNPNVSRTKAATGVRFSTYANITIDAPFA